MNYLLNVLLVAAILFMDVIIICGNIYYYIIYLLSGTYIITWRNVPDIFYNNIILLISYLGSTG